MGAPGKVVSVAATVLLALTLTSSATAWEQCNIQTCCGTGWEYTSVSAEEAASRRAYKMCEMTPPISSLAGPHPMQMMCFNGGGSLFPACPNTVQKTIPPPPSEIGHIDFCGPSTCLRQGFPSLHHGRRCALFPHFPYPITCDFWLRVFGQRILRARLHPYGVGVTQEVATAAGIVGTYRSSVTGEPLEVAEGELDLADPATLEELAPRKFWVDHHVLAATDDDMQSKTDGGDSKTEKNDD